MQILLSKLAPEQSWLFFWKNNTGALKDAYGRLVVFGAKGSSDLLGVAGPKGIMFCAEIKSVNDRQSREQKMFQSQVEAKGGKYFLLRDKPVGNFEKDIDKMLTELRNCVNS